MDLNRNATPLCLAIRESIHAFHYACKPFVVHA
ncbi:Hypothetical protein NGAL_HAMBI1146_21110 [Neorhizobium galegae bv. officinalis]|nr:Hypothetical protein NGAL_HAMBI490_17600 [Neorhizobium galegae bv. officinalis]CDZ36950.1 Hypothetical protein NGAL_HAMBI1146_21110 [Neorhizobium galegae bv. officinalis]